MTDDNQPKAGSQWRIRLPNDYVVSSGPTINRVLRKAPTLDDYNTTILEAQARFAAARLAEDAMRHDALSDMLFCGYVPPTPWQRRWAAIKRFPRRLRDAWRVLTGEAQVYDD